MMFKPLIKLFLIINWVFIAFLSITAQDLLNQPAKVVLFPHKEAVISAKINTTLLEYKFKEGEAFSKGDLIVKLDDRQYRQTFQKTEALYKFALENYRRNKEMFEKNALGALDFEQSKVERDTAEANMRLAEIDLDSCSIKAPYNGRLTKKTIKEHEFVNPGQAIMEIIDDSSLLADMHLPSERMKQLTVGDEMSFLIDETGSVHKGKIYEMSGRIDFGSRTFEVKAIIDNKDRKLFAGMSGILQESKGAK